MTDFEAAVAAFVKSFRKGRVRFTSKPFPHRFGAVLAEFEKRLCKRFEGMIVMQVKFRAALLPLESLPRRAKPAAMGYYEEYEKGSKYEQLKKRGVNHAFRERKRQC